MDGATIVVAETPEPETPESTERTLGHLEAETEHLAEEVQEATETAEAAESTAEVAIEIAASASERTFNAEEAISELRSEVNNLTEAVQALIVQSEAEDDQESSTEEIVLPDPQETEPQPEVKTSKIPSWLI